MNLKNHLHKLFFREEWSIGYRNLESESYPIEHKSRYHLIAPNFRWWFADPFCIRYEGSHFIFCEMFDSFSGIGSIGVCKYADGKMGNVRQVIKEPFHMSYPNVFCYKGSFYMIPETGRSNQIRLYKATVFPYEWELDSVLAEGVVAVDSTILEIGDKKYLFTYDTSNNEKRLLICQFDMDGKKLVFPENNGIIPDRCSKLRPAGNFIRCGEKIIRPAQYNKNCYGEKLVFYEVEEISDSGYTENEKCTVSASEVASNSGFERIHTINRHDGMEVVDLYSCTLYLLKPLLVLTRAVKKIMERRSCD